MKHLKPFDNFINETRESDLEGLADLGLGPSQLDWDVEYDEDMQNTGKSDKQEIYDYDSYILATQVPGTVPILIGKLVNQNGKYKIYKTTC